MSRLHLLVPILCLLCSSSHGVNIIGWGQNAAGQLSLPSTSPVVLPAVIGSSGILSNKVVIQAGGGLSHALVVTGDGQVLAWGSNEFGQLGNGSTGNTSSVPVAVASSGALAGKRVVAVAGGFGHSLALTQDGMVYSWGDGSRGALGNGFATNSAVPVPVDRWGVLAGKTIVQIAAGVWSSHALASDGTIYAWGNNDFGQLGDGTNTPRFTPVAVSTAGALAGKWVKQISAGGLHCLALATDGTLYAWGAGDSGRLGTGDQATQFAPVRIFSTGVLSSKTITKISAGTFQSFALTSDGGVYAWGNNQYGQLGIGQASVLSLAPVDISTSGAISNSLITSISTQFRHTIAVSSNGTVFAWGGNTVGELGYDSGTNSLSPVAVSTNSALSNQNVLGLVTLPHADFNLLLADAADSPTVVTSLADSGPGSLREVLANAPAGASISIVTTGVINLASELLLTRNVSIFAPGAKHLTINGGNATRLMTVTNGITAAVEGITFANGVAIGGFGGGIRNFGDLTMMNCQVTNCQTYGNNGGLPVYYGGFDQFGGVGGASGGWGGGIYSEGTLRLTGVTFFKNRAQGGAGTTGYWSGGSGGGGAGFGGAIFLQSGTVYATNCTFGENIAQGGTGGTFNSSSGGNDGGGGGGGGANGGTGSSGYYATHGGAGGYGGGGGGGGSRFGNGGAGGFGGGGGGGAGSSITFTYGVGGFGAGNGGHQDYLNRNGTGGGGAGMGGAIFARAGTVYLGHVTLVSNLCVGGLAGYCDWNFSRPGYDGSGLGGGLFADTGTFVLFNTALAGNSANQGPDMYFHNAYAQSAGGNFVSRVESGLPFPVATTDSYGTIAAPRSPGGISALGDNGGPTETYNVSVESSLIGRGVANTNIITDQRGFIRSQPPTIGAVDFKSLLIFPDLTNGQVIAFGQPVTIRVQAVATDGFPIKPAIDTPVVLSTFGSVGLANPASNVIAAGTDTVTFTNVLFDAGGTVSLIATSSVGTGRSPELRVILPFVSNLQKCLELDSGYAAGPNTGLMLSNTSFTIEAWVRRNYNFNVQPVVSQGTAAPEHGLDFSIQDSSFRLGFHSDDLVSAPFPGDTDKWVHFAATFDITTKKRCLYRNGELVASDTANSAFLGSGPLVIGRRYDYNAAFYGRIDDVRIWNRPLSRFEIIRDIVRTNENNTAGLMAYYNFEEADGPNVPDWSNSHDLTLNLLARRVPHLAFTTRPGQPLVITMEPFVLDGSATTMVIPDLPAYGMAAHYLGPGYGYVLKAGDVAMDPLFRFNYSATGEFTGTRTDIFPYVVRTPFATSAVMNATIFIQSFPPSVGAVTVNPDITSAKFTGHVDPNLDGTDAWFEWGTTTNYGNSTASSFVAPNQGGYPPGPSQQTVTGEATGLEPNVTYHCRLVARNASSTVYGPDTSFVTTARLTPVAWYRLGENDPDAALAFGTLSTRDFVGSNHLAYIGSTPNTAASFIPESGYSNSTSSLQIQNVGYHRAAVIADSDNWGIEAWVNASDSAGTSLIAYNGNGSSSGMGLYRSGGNYSGLLGGLAWVGSAPAVPGAWTHLALVVAGGQTTFYVNGPAQT